MMGRIAAADLLLHSDPLSEEACRSLIGYGAEDRFVDFKESFECHIEKSWIDLAIDCAAFANSEGGFIVFGVEDVTWKKVGICKAAADALRDTKKVVEKINRGYLRPHITTVGTLIFGIDDMDFAVVHVPSSPDVTHIFESNLDWKTPGGKLIRGVSRGSIYVRNSASNQVLTSADFEDVVRRRIERFREKILDGVVRAVNVSSQEEIVRVSKVVGVRGGGGVKIVDAPKDSELGGRALTFTVDSLADKIRMYMALIEPKDNRHIDPNLLFEAFARRHEQGLAPEERGWVALFSLLRHAPVFYWLKDLRTSESRRIIEAAFNAGTNLQRSFILNYAFFYGDSFYSKLHAQMPAGSARHLRSKVGVFGRGPSTNPADDERRASELALERSISTNQAAEYELERLDCTLYAPFGSTGHGVPVSK